MSRRDGGVSTRTKAEPAPSRARLRARVQRPQALGQAQVLAIVDRHLDQRRAVHGEGIAQADGEVRR